MRRRWVFVDGEAVEVERVPEPKRHDGLLYNDRLYQDDGDPRYHSRSTHREYMRRNGLTTADDFTEMWERDKRARQDRFKANDPQRKQDIADAIRKLEAGYKPKVNRG
jgi:hypothetical protein